MMRIDWRSILARAPLPMLALAASWGVYQFALIFTPWWVAVTQAAAFEATYIGLALADDLDTGQRRRATAISIGAVAASVIYNTLAGWFHAQPQLLVGASALAWLCLAILHGAPLAWVAYLVSSLLLHRAPDTRADTPDTSPVLVSVAPAVLPALPDTADTAMLERARALRQQGMPWRDVARHVGMSDATLRRRLAQSDTA